jgi:hypothetical protein
MTYIPTRSVPRERLIKDLEALGMDITGSRSDLVSRLVQAGVYQIDTSLPPAPKFVDTTNRFPNHSSILIGNGAQIHNKEDQKLVISNNSKEPSLIVGDFSKKVVSIHNCLNIQETEDFSCDYVGNDGDIRRFGDDLYMFRSCDVHAGWYPLQFGTMMLI